MLQDYGGAISIMDIVIENGIGNPNPNPGQGCLASILR